MIHNRFHHFFLLLSFILFDKGKFTELTKLYSKLKNNFKNRFYIEIQRHGDQNEKAFEKFNLSKSLELQNLLKRRKNLSLLLRISMKKYLPWNELVFYVIGVVIIY